MPGMTKLSPNKITIYRKLLLERKKKNDPILSFFDTTKDQKGTGLILASGIFMKDCTSTVRKQDTE